MQLIHPTCRQGRQAQVKTVQRLRLTPYLANPPPSCSSDPSDGLFPCPNEKIGCTFRSGQLITAAHWQYDCAFGSLQGNLQKPSSDPLKNKFSSYMTTHYVREEQGRDDNNTILLDARFWSLPVNWVTHQGLALRGQPEKARRVNYNFERLGLPVKNQKLILEIHDVTNSEWELKLFTSENLGKAHGTHTRAIQDSSQASGVAHRDEFPEIPSNGQETARTAWFNWTLVSHLGYTFPLTYLILPVVFRSTATSTRP